MGSHLICRAVLITGMAFLHLGFPLAGEQPSLHLGNRRELFVDSLVIDRLSNVRLELHHPSREGVALVFDQPWEGPFSGYPTVIRDGSLYRLYYRGLSDGRSGSDAVAVTCYAESDDGVIWRKPDLGMYEVNGTRRNNVVLAGETDFSHNFTPFLDTRPGVPHSQRFKALAGSETTGLVAFVSGDGLHWKRLQDTAVFRKGMFDSQNVAFWSESEQCYVCYFRTWTGRGYTGFRTISRTTSPDFVCWSEPIQMSFGNTPPEHLYTNATSPYVRAPHIYLAFPKRFFPGRSALPAEIARLLVEDSAYRSSSSDAVFMSTRGGGSFDRTFMQAFIRPGPDRRDWVSRDNTPALGAVQGTDRELFLYRLSHYAQRSCHLVRYALRLDGFVSIRAGYAQGEVLTKLITFSGDSLELNFSSSAGGGLRVEIQDSLGNPLRGYSLTECEEMLGDEISRVVRWKGAPPLSRHAGVPVRLRVVLRDADLFSFRFR